MKRNNTINVLMVGSSTKVHGGMTTVVESFLEYKFDSTINLKYVPTHIDSKHNSLKILYFIISLLKILSILFFHKIDIAHIHMSERGSFKRKYTIFLILKFFKKKIITHTHGAEFKEFYIKETERGKRKIKRLLKGSDIVITLGEKWDKIIKEIEPYSKTYILRNSVSIPKKKNKILKKQNYNILFLAVLIERKGIIDLINASTSIIDRLKKEKIEVKFIIAGDGEYFDKSKALVRELNISDNFEFKGWIDKKAKIDILENSDLFVLPSYNEGLPLSILEAISHGIPIISTNVGSIDEAVYNGQNGYLINPGDVKELSNKIVRILTIDNISEMSNCSRNIAEEKFNIEKYFQEIEEIYFQLKNDI